MLAQKSVLLSGATMGGLAVGLGAFGAHALKPMLEAHDAMATYTLAAQYQFFHALALLAVGLLMNTASRTKLLGTAALCMVLGIILFSGSLFWLALTGSRSVVLITPLGGLFFLSGWTLLIVAILKNKRGPEGPRDN